MAPGAVEGQHPQSPQAFPQRVGSGEHLELAGDEAVISGGELGLDAVLSRRQPGFFEPHRLGPGERGIGYLGQRRAAPQPEGLPQHAGRLGVLTGGGQLPSPRAQRFEPERVDGLVVDPQHVARGPGPQRLAVGSQGLAKAGDVDPQSIGGTGWGRTAPEVFGQHLGGHDPVGGEHQQRQEGAFTGTLEPENLTVANHLKSAENPVFQRHALPRDAVVTGMVGVP